MLWTERKVNWYQRALERSDYAEKILGAIESILPECESALDVGAGCGALAFPLARRLGRVTAIEPAPAMAKALREGAEARRLRNITVIEARWGDVSVAPHDLVLCAHVGELVRPDSGFLREASGVARRWVVLVRDAEEARDKFFFRELYPLLLGRPYTSSCDYEETVDSLSRLGVVPSVTFVEYRSDQPFVSFDEACDFWEEYLEVRGERVREFLRGFLETRLVREGDGWVAPYEKRVAVIRWPGEAER